MSFGGRGIRKGITAKLGAEEKKERRLAKMEIEVVKLLQNGGQCNKATG